MPRYLLVYREKDANVLGKDDVVLATAPTLSIREVKTYARIANETPFIVGGLIAKDSEENLQKVPLLGDLPLLGKLFQSKTETGQKERSLLLLPLRFCLRIQRYMRACQKTRTPLTVWS